MSFVHLHTHSHYSLLDGLSKIKDLVREAARMEMPALAITDHGNLYGAIEFYKAAKSAGIKPIIGVEAYIASRSLKDKEPGVDERRYHLILLAENDEGYHNLIELVTTSHLEGFYYKPRMDKELLRKHSKGIIALSGCMSGEISRAVARNDTESAQKLVSEYKDIFLAVQTNSKIDNEDRLTMKAGDFSFRSPKAMREFFKDFPDACDNTLKIANRVRVSIPMGVIQLPHYDVPGGKGPEKYLAELCYERLPQKYPAVTLEIKKRLDYELGVIGKTGFSTYFLMVQDFVNWARTEGIVVGPGRGSAAGSLVSYVLGITNIDPIAYNLIFERFMNPDRISPPDIDLDFADTGRDRVLEYVRNKYGRDKVASIITFGTMAARAAIRDAGRALGVPYALCDQLAKLIPFNPTQGMKEGWLAECLEDVEELKKIYKENAEAK